VWVQSALFIADIDPGGYQFETLGANGRILSLGSFQRCFNGNQRHQT
jgi:hypothetical protein